MLYIIYITKLQQGLRKILKKLAELDIRPPSHPHPHPQKKIHRGSYMHAHVLLNLSSKLRKRDQKQCFAKVFFLFYCIKFNTWTIELLWNQVFAAKTLSCCVIQMYMQGYVITLQKYVIHWLVYQFKYSKTCLKQPLKNRQNKGLKDKWFGAFCNTFNLH